MTRFSFCMFLTLVAVIRVVAAPVVDAQESDLYPTIIESIDPALPGDHVDYTVSFANAGPDNAIQPILNLYVPPNQPADLQAYIDGDPDAMYLIDEILGASITVTRGEVGFYFASTCEGFLIQVDIDADNSGFGAGESGKLSYTLPITDEMPAYPTVHVTGSLDQDLFFGRGTCDDCVDFEGTCFGPRMSSIDAITAPLKLVDDASGEWTDGCEPLVGFTPGHIALVDRGTCNFDLKAANAQQAGASAIIIGQNVGDDRLGPDGILDPACVDFCGLITIPVVFVSMNNNVALQEDLSSGEVMATVGAVKSEYLTTWAHVWENDANATDIDQDNDDWLESTMIDFIIFGDGFESGSLSAWIDLPGGH